jgi:hypothetical protein
MRTRYHLGTFAGVRVSVGPPVVIGWLLLWGLLIGMGVGWLHAGWVAVLLGALGALALHLLSELIHQLVGQLAIGLQKERKGESIARNRT